jgi:hypothetical protein
MKSTAATAKAYLDSLPPHRREALQTVRLAILGSMDKGLEERMQYGVIGYCVPHRVWPHGHHTRPELPLMYMGLSSQKNDMVVYMLFLLHNAREREWFDAAWKGTGKKNYLEVSGAGCCLRFKKIEDLSLDVIGEAMRRMPVEKYLEDHIAALARMGKGPDGKALRKSGAGGSELGRRGGAKAKSASAAPKRKTAGKTAKTTRKKAGAKRG